MYQYVEFDGVSLPLLMHEQQHDPVLAEPTLRDSIGSAYDWRGSQRQRGRKQIIPLRGEFIGESEYLVDDGGDFLVDENGDVFVAATAVGAVHDAMNQLLGKVGVRGKLWRKRLSDDALHWKTTRLLAVNLPRSWEDRGLIARPRCQFETQMEFWHAENANVSSGSATSGADLPLLVDNAGVQVDDAVFSVLCTSNTITAVDIVCETLGIDLNWTGTLDNGEMLVIDGSDDEPPDNIVAAYSGLSRGADHTARDWLPIAPGTHLFFVTVTGGSATVTITFYNQFP